MALTIFNPAAYADIQQRINQLAATSPRQWGNMTLPQMVGHCGIQLKKALGILPETAVEGPAFYRTSVGRWLILYAMPWPKGSPTPIAMNMLTNQAQVPDIAKAKTELLQLLQRLQGKDSFKAHPFFGKLTKKDWGRLIWKHLDHHLRQFGV